jgi:hypothetical protein
VSRRLGRSRPLPLIVIGFRLAGGLSSCGKAGITAETTCKDYYTYDSQTRYDAAVWLSAAFHSPDPGNPMWGPNLDYSCGQSPGQTIGQILAPQ